MAGVDSRKFDDLRASIASREPTPGGGAVVGACASLAAALACMVTRFSQGRKGCEQHETTYDENLNAFERASGMFTQLAEEDMGAYAALSELLKLDKDDPQRAEAMPGAVVEAVRVPLSIMGLSLALMRRYEAMAPIANTWLLSDLAISAELTASAGLAASHLVRANAPLLEKHAPDDRSFEQSQTMAREISDLRGAVLGLCA